MRIFLIMLLIITIGTKYVLDDMERVQFIVDSQYPNIAHKAYLTGCLESSGHNCHAMALIYKNDLKQFMDKIGTN